jgi:hypothetical protein
MSPSTDNGSTIPAPGGRSVGSSAFDDRPDDFFAVVAGLTLAALLAPLATAVAARVLADLALSYIFLLVAGALVTTVGALTVRRIRGLPERIGRSRGHRVLGLVGPALVGVVALGLYFAGDLSGADGVLALLAGGGSAVGGGLLGLMSRSRYAKAVVAESEQYATWRAGWSERRKRPLQFLAGAGVVGGSVAFVVALVVHSDLLRLAGQFAIPLGAVGYSMAQPRTYTATAAGLETQLPAARKLHGWDRFEGYVLADDAVVIHQRAPWRLPIICAREELDDEDAVVAALDRALPRLPSPRA